MMFDIVLGNHLGLTDTHKTSKLSGTLTSNFVETTESGHNTGQKF